MDRTQMKWSKKIFLSLFSHPQEHTNLTILMDAKQWARTLLLLKIFGPFVLYSHHTTQKVHYHCNNHRYHAIVLDVDVLQTNQGHISTAIDHL